MPKAEEQIGPYTLVRQLGRGAFGVVWLAERRGAFATTQVALKMALDDEPDLEGIRQESQLWAQLSGHANVLPIIEADRYDGNIVIVSEYAPDGSLETWLKNNDGKAPSVDVAVTMACGILAGLEHLHSRRIIHRDLKPANILLQGETPRLADFGLARVLKSSKQSVGVAGTPAYMAPENFGGERSEQSDIWSVGVILYQMLTGKLPFPQTDLIALMGAIGMQQPARLPDSLPKNLQPIINKALEKTPAQRFLSAGQMRAALLGQSVLATNPDLLVRATSPIENLNVPTSTVQDTKLKIAQVDTIGNLTTYKVNPAQVSKAPTMVETQIAPAPSRKVVYFGVGAAVIALLLAGFPFIRPLLWPPPPPPGKPADNPPVGERAGGATMEARPAGPPPDRRPPGPPPEDGRPPRPRPGEPPPPPPDFRPSGPPPPGLDRDRPRPLERRREEMRDRMNERR